LEPVRKNEGFEKIQMSMENGYLGGGRDQKKRGGEKKKEKINKGKISWGVKRGAGLFRKSPKKRRGCPQPSLIPGTTWRMKRRKTLKEEHDEKI